MATDGVRGEYDLARSADGFASALLDGLQVGVAAFDESGRLILANRALHTLYQLPYQLTDLTTVDELVRESLAPADRSPVGVHDTGGHHPVDRALTGEAVDGAEARVVVPDGPPRHAEVNFRPIRSDDGRPLGAVASFRDTTARNRVDRFHECERLVARALAEATTVADVGPALVRAVAGSLGWPHAQLWLVDEVSDVMRPAAQWDAPGRTLEGVTPTTVPRGWGIGGIVWETGEPMWIPDLLHTDQVPTSNFAHRARQAAAVGVRAAVSVPVCDGRTVLGVLSCVADHREYDGDRLVAQLGSIANQVGHFLSRRRAEELAQELSDAHDDFRTLLRAFVTDPEGADAARDDLLDLAALEDGAAHLDLRRFDFAAVVSEAVTASARSSGASVHVGLPDDLSLRGDARRLHSLVDVLLHAAGGGDVYVRLRAEPGVAELTVIGVGAPSDDGARSAVDTVAGVPRVTRGPRLVRAVARAHGGTVRVESGYLPDVTFTVRLPIEGPPDRPAPTRRIPTRWAGS